MCACVYVHMCVCMCEYVRVCVCVPVFSLYRNLYPNGADSWFTVVAMFT